MPMDENEKKELVKKIMEQRKAMWKGESTSDRPQRQPRIKPKESTTINVIRKTPSPESTNVIDNTIPVDFEIPDKKGAWRRITEELKKSSELGWKAFLIMVALIGAIMLGVLIGYLMSTTGLMSKLKL